MNHLTASVRWRTQVRGSAPPSAAARCGSVPRMLPGEHHHSSRVAQMACALVRPRQLTYTVVDHEPAVPGQDGRTTPANFQPSPRGNRRRQTAMRIEQAQVLNFDAVSRHWTVGNPDAFKIG